MDVSIIIVNYNTCVLTRNCLKSVFEQTKDIDFEVIVSDNGSKDGSIEMIKQEFPQVILIENNANLGFGAANNRGLKNAKGKYIFYLNSDTILLNNAVKIFFDYWENSPDKDKIGALGGNLLDENGNVVHSYGSFLKPFEEVIRLTCRLFIVLFCLLLKKNPKRNNKKYEKYIGEVEYVTGADLFMKNDQNCIFDERYFLYCEETDMQWKIMKLKLKRMIIDGPMIVHFEGRSDKTKQSCFIDHYCSFGNIQLQLSRIRFQKYNRSRFAARLMKIMLYLLWMLPIYKDKTFIYRSDIWKI